MKKSLLIIFLFCSAVLNSQTWVWAKDCPSSPNGVGDGTSSCVDPFGNIYITGIYQDTLIAGNYTLTTNTSSGVACYLIKYDTNGSLLWAATSVGDGENSYGVTTDALGNVYIAGSFQNSVASFGTYTLNNYGYSSVFLIKYNSNGNVLWARSSNSTGDDEAYAICSDGLNNIYITGIHSSSVISFGTNTLTVSPSASAAFIVKYDPAGNALWARNSTSTNYDRGSAICALSNNDVVVSGYFSSPTFSFSSQTASLNMVSDIFNAKFDSNGNLIWLNSASSNGSDYPNSSSSDGFGNFYVTGNFNGSQLVIGTNTLSGGVASYFIAKYNSSGNVIWAKTCTGSVDFGLSVASYSSGVFVSGSMDNTSIAFGTLTVNPAVSTGDRSFLVQYDLNGNAIYGVGLESGGDDWLPVCTDKNCNVFLSGDYATSTFALGSTTLNLSGGETTFIAKLSYCSTSPDYLDEHINSNNGIQLFPNPNNGKFILKFENEIVGGKLILINSLGQIVHSEKISGSKSEVHLKNISTGLYQSVIFERDRIVDRRKIIIE